nr:retrovirus-related Pol polyprotein from transposon TNT 1-94 [Tanacetum cinerariifolium]
MDEFCSRKGVKREFSNERTPQQNGVAERRNRTLIEAARPCKFDAKGDEGYFVRYSLSSKAFRVFNKRTKKIKENLHVDFLGNRSIEKGTGHDWLFDINTLTNSMNYVLVVVTGTSSTNILGTKEDVHQAVNEKDSPLRFIDLPNWFHEAQMETSNAAATKDDAIPDNNAPQKEKEEVNRDKEVLESSRNSNPTASTKVSSNDSFELASSSTVEIKVPIVSTPVPTGSLSIPMVTSSLHRIISRGGSSFPEPLSLGNAMSFKKRLEDFFGDTYDAVSLNDVEADLSIIETPIEVSPTLTFRIHKDHPKIYQMDVKSAFSYRTIDEEVYVVQPPSFQDLEFPHRVYKVEKAMSGLHQAPRAWYGTLSKYLLNNGFQRDIKVAKTYMDRENHWGKDVTSKDVELHSYRSMIGSLMYFTGSRSDIMFAVYLLTKAFDVGRFQYLVGGDSGNSANGLNRDLVVNTCLNFLHGSDSEQWTHEFMHIYLVFASVCVWIGVETTDGETKIPAKDNGRQRNVSESSIRRHLKLNDEEGLASMLVPQDEGSKHPSEPHHIPSYQDEPIHHEQITQSPQHAQITSHEPISQFSQHEQTTSQEPTIPSQYHSIITTPRRIIRRTIRIYQSKVPSPGADETAFPTGDVRYGEAFPTDTSLDAGQDKENIAKTSAMPHEASPRVTSLGGGESSIQQKLQELMDICTSLQRQHSLMEERVQSQDLEITQLKTKVKTLEDNEKRREGFAQADAPNTRGVDQGEDLLVGDTVKDSDKSADKGSDSTNEMANVLGTLGAANILASGGLRSVFTTASTVVSPAVATASGSFPTSVIFTTASVATLTTRVTRSSRGVVIESSSPISVNIPSISKKDKGKGKMTEPEQPSKEKVLEQMSVQLARDLEAKFAQEDQIIREQAERDSEIAMIHAEREIEMMITELDRSNEMIAKYLSEYEQAEAGLSHDEKVELIDELLMYQRHLAQIKKYQAQQKKPIEEKFIPVWEKIQDFVPMNSKLESERLKRPGIQLGKESFKKLKIVEVLGWEIYFEVHRKYWKNIRVENHTEAYQIFDDMLKKFDREDLDKIWSLVKETCSTTEVTDEKEKEL